MPGITGQKIEIPLEYNEEHSDELKALLAKKELNESEWLRRDELLAEKRAQREEAQKSKRSYIFHGEGFRKLRYSTLFYVILLWIAYASLLPKNYIEYSLSGVFPVLFFVTGLIHSVELLFIALILMLAAMLKMGLFSGKNRSMTDSVD